MSSRQEEALIEPIVGPVSALIDAVLHDDAPAVLQLLSEKSLKREGMALFGISAIGIPLGLAASPEQVGLSMAEVGEEMAVAEVRGRNEGGDDVSVSTVVLTSENGDWKVDDIWPVPVDLDFTVDVILEPTVMFYNGEAQLEVQQPEKLESVDRLLIGAMQADGLGLHLLEHGLRFWRTLHEENAIVGDVKSWAAAVHMAVLVLEGVEPDLAALSATYGVSEQALTARFFEIARKLGFQGGDAPPPAPVQQPSGLVDPYGRPLSGDRGSSSGIILPRG